MRIGAERHAHDLVGFHARHQLQPRALVVTYQARQTRNKHGLVLQRISRHEVVAEGISKGRQKLLRLWLQAATDGNARVGESLFDGLHDLIKGRRRLLLGDALHALLHLSESRRQKTEHNARASARRILLRLHVVRIGILQANLLGLILNRLSALFNHAPQRRNIAVENIGENTKLFGEIHQRRSTQSDDLGVARVQKKAIEEVAAVIQLRSLLTEARRPAIMCYFLYRDCATDLLSAGPQFRQIGLDVPLHQTNKIVDLIHDNDGVVKELSRIRVAGHRHQLLGRNAVVGDELDAARGILFGMPFHDGQNLLADLVAIGGIQALIVGLGLRLAEIRHPDVSGILEVFARETENLIGEQGRRGIFRIQRRPEVVQLEMAEAAEADFAEKVLLQREGCHNDNLLSSGGIQGLGCGDGCTCLS